MPLHDELTLDQGRDFELVLEGPDTGILKFLQELADKAVDMINAHRAPENGCN